MALRITIAFSDNPRLDPLKDGAVKPQGIDLDFVTVEPRTLFYRNLVYDEFDAPRCQSPRHCYRANAATARVGTDRRCRYS
jgi:4,5-dihydroxyphthalate decarboxylase